MKTNSRLCVSFSIDNPVRSRCQRPFRLSRGRRWLAIAKQGQTPLSGLLRAVRHSRLHVSWGLSLAMIREHQLDWNVLAQSALEFGNFPNASVGRLDRRLREER
ncbi:unnamed protein product [Mycena citricolor]|uniref:Uncharacterized protein n=1 Tax=Mycena citricolor TaxID=2018698 RepID=A0AAD2HLS3_9AGAR|nr:unnamed protein product [Mycena citricolor]CAK5278774.1 unnamed protein product [Mycena citricolor]